MEQGKGWKEHCKKGGLWWFCVRQDHSKRKHFRRGKRRSVGQHIYHHGIFWQSGTERKEGGEEASRGVFLFLACLSFTLLFSDLVDIFETSFYYPVCVFSWLSCCAPYHSNTHKKTEHHKSWGKNEAWVFDRCLGSKPSSDILSLQSPRFLNTTCWPTVTYRPLVIKCPSTLRTCEPTVSSSRFSQTISLAMLWGKVNGSLFQLFSIISWI